MGDKSREIGTVIGHGSLTAALYYLLFLYDVEILALTSKGGWAFIVPVTIAFAISFTHGAFTSVFWDLFEIKAKK